MQGVRLINFTDLGEQEALMVLAWRNDERVAKFMKNKSVSEREHFSFLQSLKGRGDKRYFLVAQAEQNGKNEGEAAEYIGVIDFTDITAHSCEFGLYANPQLKGCGKALMHGVLAYGFRVLNVKEMSAYAFNENEKAVRLYLNFGFEMVKNDGKFSFLKLKNEGEIMQIVMKNYKFLTDGENRQILAIRNLEHIRNMSLSDKIIGFDEHKKWLQTPEGATPT